MGKKKIEAMMEIYKMFMQGAAGLVFALIAAIFTQNIKVGLSIFTAAMMYLILICLAATKMYLRYAEKYDSEG